MSDSWKGLPTSLALSLASGLILAVLFLCPWLLLPALIAPVALVPWIVLISPRGLAASPWTILPGAYLCALLLGLDLVKASLGVGLLIPLLFCTFLLPFAAILRRVDRRWGAVGWLVVPLVWVGTEWLRCTFSPGSLEIFLLGHTVAGIPVLVQAAGVIGSYGVSFCVAAVNSALALEVIRKIERSRGVPDERGRGLRLGILGVLLCLWVLQGLVSLSPRKMADAPRIFAVRMGKVWEETDRPWDQEKLYVEQTYETVPREGGADLIVWPKEAIPDILLYDQDYLGDLKNLGEWFRAPFLVGARGASARWETYRIVAVHVTAGGDPARDYAQMQLTPGLEYAPLELQLRRFDVEWGDAIRRSVSGGLGAVPRLVPGHDLRTFDLSDEMSLGAPLGLEVLSHSWCRGAKEKGASFLVSLDRRRWMGSGVSKAVLLAATFRARENRISIVRIEEGGFAYLIGPSGRLVRLARECKRSDPAFTVEVPILATIPEGTTRGGEIIGRIAAALTLILFGWSLLQTCPRREKRGEGIPTKIPPPVP